MVYVSDLMSLDDSYYCSGSCCVLQYVTVCCGVLWCGCVAGCCRVLQGVAGCCGVLQ